MNTDGKHKINILLKDKSRGPIRTEHIGNTEIKLWLKTIYIEYVIRNKS